IRVEYGWNCKDFSLAVPAGFSATRYRRFDGENLAIFESNSVVTLPSCFKVIPNGAQAAAALLRNTLESTTLPSPPAPQPVDPAEEYQFDDDDDLPTVVKPEIINGLNAANTTIVDLEDEENFVAHYWNIITSDSNLPYTIVVLIVLVALIPICIGVCYRVYCGQHRRSDWTLEHPAHMTSGSMKSKDELNNVSVHSHIDMSTQTTDTPIRI
ncbi:unnamed protein product, partial [Adineta ricciae]